MEAGSLDVQCGFALAQGRPSTFPEGAPWVYVDLDKQTLTAYEGDRLVFATLVSTGKPGFSTPTGIFRVWYKTRHTTMNGRREPYHVEEVPDVMYFHGSDGLHGAFWHDCFGRPSSHGCINLSPADAQWLFGWAPPTLPPGWHSVLPPPTSPSLRLVVGRGEPHPAASRAQNMRGTHPDCRACAAQR